MEELEPGEGRGTPSSPSGMSEESTSSSSTATSSSRFSSSSSSTLEGLRTLVYLCRVEVEVVVEEEEEEEEEVGDAAEEAEGGEEEVGDVVEEVEGGEEEEGDGGEEEGGDATERENISFDGEVCKCRFTLAKDYRYGKDFFSFPMESLKTLPLAEQVGRGRADCERGEERAEIK